MKNLTRNAVLGIAGLATAGLVAWQAPAAIASHGADDARPDHARHHHAEPGDDHGRHAEPGDDHGRHAEPGDDHGRHAEPGDDHGRHRGRH